MTKYIDFSIDYDGNCECVDDFLINDEEVSINDDSDVQPLIDELQKVEGFYLSEHRTQVRVWWNEDGTMDVRYRFYNEPDWGEFDDYELLGLPPVEFEPEVV
jgi:hypothetical protein